MLLKGSELSALLATPEELRPLWFEQLPDGTKKFRPFKTPTFRKVLAEVGRSDPDAYVRLSKTLSDAGLEAAYLEGDTVGLDDLAPPIDTKPFFDKMEEALQKIPQDLPQEKRVEQINNIHSSTLEKLHNAVMSAAEKKGNSLHRIVTSGARGNPTQFRAMVSAPGTYVDFKGRQLPIFVRKGFNEGVDPIDYLASSFGTRSSIISIKKATAQGGDIAKQLQNVAARMVVREEDCGTTQGILLDPDDDSLFHRVLAQPAGDLPAGTLITGKIADKLKASGKPVQVRSALTCSTHNGICSKCMGAGPSGKLRPVGYHAGSTAASSVGEPLAQGALSAKHLGGMGTAKKKFTGIGVVAQLLQSPENFPDKAAVAKASGIVRKVEPAPQGGTYIEDDQNNRLYVEPGLAVNVAPGDEVDAGQVLSDGLVDTEDVVAAAGIGAGRQAMVQQLGQVLSDSNAKTDRRHLEVLSRASVNFLENNSDDPDGDYLPGDIITYDDWRKKYSPPVNTKFEAPEKAIGKYLEEPALHYTLKTPITKKVVDDLKTAGISRVAVSDTKGETTPGFLRLRTPYASAEDWIVAQTGSYLKSRMENAVTRGSDSAVDGNDHYAPALARGKDFGRNTERTGLF